jgi:hypothetical protein
MLSYGEDFTSEILVKVNGEVVMVLDRIYETDEGNNTYNDVIKYCRMHNQMNKGKKGYVPFENIELWQSIYYESGMNEEIRLTTIKVSNKLKK